jgi:2-octaprenyl-6-methoxyphenol hydroxylase
MALGMAVVGPAEGGFLRPARHKRVKRAQRKTMARTTKATGVVDVLIAGGGHVGLALALALKRAAPDLSVMLVDPASARRGDGRASAIAAAGRRMLDSLGVWQAMVDDAQPITDMIITDSRTRDVVRPVFLTFAGTIEDGEPFAHMVTNDAMVSALETAARAAEATIVAGEAVADFTTGPATVAVSLGSGRAVEARLLVAADGVKSRLRAFAGIRTASWSYGQSGIVATVAHERPHGGRAEEHFLPGGPFAILPLTGNRSSLVWTEERAAAERIVADPLVFQIELERRFGHKLGPLDVVGKPRAYPLGLLLAREFVKPRFALAGDSAHGIHPIAGQGLNLGFRDVAALAETVVEAHRLGLDIGALSVLERYQRWRRFDTVEMGAVTDVLNRLFSNDNPALRLVRDIGLGIVDRLPELKRRFIDEAAGSGGDLPRLLRGEAI